MGLGAGLVHWLTHGGLLDISLAAVAIGAADHGVGLLWRRIGEGVRQAWMIPGTVALVLLLLVGVAPDSGLSRSLSG